MADSIETAVDVLSAPIEDVITALGSGIARAQRDLDRQAIDSQREIDEDPILSQTGLQATFYQIPKADLELTVALSLAVAQSSSQTRAALPSVQIQPVNAKYSSQFGFDVQASSKVKLTIVPVPAPGSGEDVPARMTRDEVLEIATPMLTGSSGARLSVNFNARSRTWFVLEFKREGDVTTRLVLVVIDDETGTIIKSDVGATEVR